VPPMQRRLVSRAGVVLPVRLRMDRDVWQLVRVEVRGSRGDVVAGAVGDEVGDVFGVGGVQSMRPVWRRRR